MYAQLLMDFAVKSSLPVVRQAVRSEKIAADNRMDRMTIWIRNVEREQSFPVLCVLVLIAPPQRSSRQRKKTSHPQVSVLFLHSLLPRLRDLPSIPVRNGRVDFHGELLLRIRYSLAARKM